MTKLINLNDVACQFMTGNRDPYSIQRLPQRQSDQAHETLFAPCA